MFPLINKFRILDSPVLEQHGTPRRCKTLSKQLRSFRQSTKSITYVRPYSEAQCPSHVLCQFPVWVNVISNIPLRWYGDFRSHIYCNVDEEQKGVETLGNTISLGEREWKIAISTKSASAVCIQRWKKWHEFIHVDRPFIKEVDLLSNFLLPRNDTEVLYNFFLLSNEKSWT